ncbi:LacI family DNA-binding transcriptional regulator [Fulvitalea axinellae]
MKKKTSLSDIAKALDVSTTLVSLVLNGKAKEHRISQRMCEKVKAKAKELNYVPNHLARGLRTGKTNTLGLIVADIANPFFAKLSRAVEDEADKHGLKVIFGSSDENAEKSAELIRIFQDRQMDGIIVAAAEKTEDQIEELLETKTPVVLVDRYFPDLNVDLVAVDNYQASFNAVEHLVSQGHKRIGMIGIRGDIYHLQKREEGFRDGLKAHGLEENDDWIRFTSSWKEFSEISEQLEHILSSPERPTALFLAKNHLGVGALEYFQNKGIRVPEDMAIVSFDDSETFRLASTPVTAVEQPIEQLGREAVKLVVEKVKGKVENKEYREVFLQTQMLVRESSGPHED